MEEEYVSICQDCRERINYPPWPPHKRFASVPKSMESIN